MAQARGPAADERLHRDLLLLSRTVVLGHDGKVVLVLSLDIADGQVQTLRAVTNPDKLRHLGR
jgi:hypothetical protein